MLFREKNRMASFENLKTPVLRKMLFKKKFFFNYSFFFERKFEKKKLSIMLFKKT